MINTKLAHVRNMLFRKRFGQEEELMLMEAKEFAIENDSPFFILIEKCIENCLYDINLGSFESAGREIDFIHNLPISRRDITNWDEHYFYSCEVPSYFEITEISHRVKSYIYEIAKAQNKINESGVIPRRVVTSTSDIPPFLTD